MSKFAPAVALFLFSLAGCATTVKGLKQDPSFTFDSIKTSGLHVGGVVSAVAELSPSDVTTFSSVLRSGLLDERKDIPVHDPGFITSAIGMEKRSAMLAEYKNAGVISAKWLEEIRSKAPSARYVVFARIDEDAVKKERTKETLYDSKDKEKKNPIGQRIKSEISRNMNASLAIYDIAAGAFVWGGSVDKSKSDSRQYDTRLDDDVAVALNMINRVLNDEDKLYPYPPEPARRDVLASIFRGFAENLPKPAK